MKEIDKFYQKLGEPDQGCLLALRRLILDQDADVTEAWKYGMPFFCYKGKMFCYLWVHKKYKQPYIGIVEGQRFDHPDLLLEKRARMKIMLFDPNKDLPVSTIKKILKMALHLYKSGEIKV